MMKPLEKGETVRAVSFRIPATIEIQDSNYQRSMRPGKIRVTISLEDREGYLSTPQVTGVEILEVSDGKGRDV